MSSAWKDEITEIIINIIKGRDSLRIHTVLSPVTKGQVQSLRLEMRWFKTKGKDVSLQILIEEPT